MRHPLSPDTPTPPASKRAHKLRQQTREAPSALPRPVSFFVAVDSLTKTFLGRCCYQLRVAAMRHGNIPTSQPASALQRLSFSLVVCRTSELSYPYYVEAAWVRWDRL